MPRFSDHRHPDMATLLAGTQLGCPCVTRMYSLEPAVECEEPYITGTNILRDPSFELGPVFDGGPTGDRIPQAFTFQSTCPGKLEYIVGPRTCAYTTTLGWASDIDGGLIDRRHRFVTTDPRTGTYHVSTSDAFQDGVEDPLYPVGGLMCVEGSQWGFYSAIVQPGTVYTYSVWHKRTSTGGIYRDFVQVDIVASDGATVVLTDFQYGATITTSWSQATYTGVAPAGSHYLVVGSGCDRVSGFADSGTYFYQDDAILEII